MHYLTNPSRLHESVISGFAHSVPNTGRLTVLAKT
jgi:hypothetical protein